MQIMVMFYSCTPQLVSISYTTRKSCLTASHAVQRKDFVGVNARRARRVGPQYTALRCLQRYLVHAAEKLTPEFAAEIEK